jgi:hypothetical protein
MMVFGRDFDQECAWAREILSDIAGDPTDRIEDVYEAAKAREES